MFTELSAALFVFDLLILGNICINQLLTDWLWSQVLILSKYLENFIFEPEQILIFDSRLDRSAIEYFLC